MGDALLRSDSSSRCEAFHLLISSRCSSPHFVTFGEWCAVADYCWECISAKQTIRATDIYASSCVCALTPDSQCNLRTPVSLAVGAPHRKLKAIVDEITRAEGVALGMLHSEHAFALMKEARYARMPNPLPQPASSYSLPFLRFEEAMAAWKEAAALVPWDAQSPFIGEWRSAAASTSRPEPGMVLTMYAMFNHLQGRHDEAMSLYDRRANSPFSCNPSLMGTFRAHRLRALVRPTY